MQQVIWRIPWTESKWFPEGVPIYGFGLMLFIAFILCTWLTSWRVKWMMRRGIGLGRYVGGPHEGEDFPVADKPDEKEALKEKEEAGKAVVQDLAIWLFVAGLVGARLTYMYYHGDAGGNFWAQLIDITNGGIILYGSVIGALIGYAAYALYLYQRRRVLLNALRIADLTAPALALGIGLGRIGCLLNGCCYGHVACAACALAPAVQFPLSAPPRVALVDKGYQTAAGFTVVDQPFGDGAEVGAVDPGSPAYQAGLRKDDLIVAVNGKRLENSGAVGLTRALFIDWPRGQNRLTLTVKPADGGDERTVGPFSPRTIGLYPTQLFETVSMALLFLLLLAFFAYRRHDGQVVALLMMCYAVHRTLNEMLRDDVRPGPFEANTSYILFAAGVVLMIWVTWWRPVQYKSEWELAT